MSVPNIPNITPKICLNTEDILNLLLSSIALEEISLSNIMDAESQKLTTYINSHTCNENYFDEICTINNSINSVLDKVCSIENLLVNKLKIICEININSSNKKDTNLKSENNKCSNSNFFSSANCDFCFDKDKC